jgi:hypothetical protein
LADKLINPFNRHSAAATHDDDTQFVPRVRASARPAPLEHQVSLRIDDDTDTAAATMYTHSAAAAADTNAIRERNSDSVSGL